MKNAHIHLAGEADHRSVAERVFDWLQPFGRGPTYGKSGKQDHRDEFGVVFLVMHGPTFI